MFQDVADRTTYLGGHGDKALEKAAESRLSVSEAKEKLKKKKTKANRSKEQHLNMQHQLRDFVISKTTPVGENQ